MKIKNISILFLILVFTGFALLGSTQVWGATCPDPQINVTDCCCSDAEKAANLCIEAFGYVIQVYVDPDTTDPTGAWPIPGSDPDDPIEFRYKGCAKYPACKGSTVNYLVQDLTACDTVVDFIVGSDPPGANLLLPGASIPKCPTITAAPGHALLKLNPSLNCQEEAEVVYSYFAAAGTPTSLCNYTVIVTKKGCDGDYLWGPGCPKVVGLLTERLPLCDDDIIVYRDPCGEPACVEILGKVAKPCNPVICFDPPDCKIIVDLRGQGLDAGPASTGCYLRCGESPIYGWGDDYWCYDDGGDPGGCS